MTTAVTLRSGFHRRYAWAAIIGIAVVFATVACMRIEEKRGKQAEQAEIASRNERDLKDLLRRMHEAVVSENLDQFLSCYDDRERYRPLQRELFRNMALCYKFQAALLTAYGEDGLNRFTDARSAKPGMVFFPPLPPANEPWWEELEFTIEESEAFYYDPWKGATIRLVRENGVWLLDLSDLTSTPEDDLPLARLLNRAYEQTLPEIGMPGVTVDDIRRKLGERA